jgi:hypothetical protein
MQKFEESCTTKEDCQYLMSCFYLIKISPFVDDNIWDSKSDGIK